MSFGPPPESSAWRHRESRSGFEVAFFHPFDDGHRIEGATTAVEDGQIWVVEYEIQLDTTWTTRRARVTGRSAQGQRSTMLVADGDGRWQVDGVEVPALYGCLDVDLECSAMTNALPVRRMQLATGQSRDSPAAYVRAPTVAVERLEQTYRRIGDQGSHQRYDYTAARFDFGCRLTYDDSGLPLDYPGIAVRSA